MKRFADLYDALDATTSTNAKVAALDAYFRAAPAEDAAWALYFLTGQRPKRLLSVRLLAEWAMQEANVPPWLFEASYAVIGDLAESVTLLLDDARKTSDMPLHQWVARIFALRDRDPEDQRKDVLDAWKQLARTERFLFVKLLTGEMRVGVSGTLVMRALSQIAGVEPPVIAQRMMGQWEPTAEFFKSVLSSTTEVVDSRPYPFCLAYQLDEPIEALGDIDAWQVEWKWDGIRGQLIRRHGKTYLWSRGEELLTDRFPEIVQSEWPEGTVLDGEVLAFKDGKPLPFAEMQRRIGRQKLSPKILADVPVVFMAYDLLQENWVDLREAPLEQRRAKLEQITVQRSEIVKAQSWEQLAKLRETSRARGVEGFMLKRKDSPYRTGRKRGDWWKWKIDPYTIDAVLTYAQPGSGRRANLLTDYTFGVWHAGELVTIAKAYSGLTDAEIAELDRWIRANTIEKFGPVRHCKAEHVFELGFEGIALSTRHKAGVAVRFPRMLRWRTDKQAKDADTLETVKRLIVSSSSPP